MIRLFKHYVPQQLLQLAIAEVIILFSSMYAGVQIRFLSYPEGHVEIIGPIFPKAFIFTIVMLSIMTALGLYQREHREEGETGHFVRFVASYIVGFIVMAFIFYVADLYLGRGAFILTFLVAFTGTTIARFLFHKFSENKLLKQRVLLLGAGSRVAKVETLEKDAKGKHKFHLVGCLPMSNTENCFTKTKIIDEQGSLLTIAKKYKVDEIIVGVRERRGGGIPTDQLLECKLAGIEIVDLPSFFERETGQIQIESLNPSWMIFSDGFQRSSVKDMAKRFFDIVSSSVLLLTTLPVFLITALFIWIESGSPVLYRQERVGEYGRIFKVLKFRSMRHNAEPDGVPQWAGKQDDRITRFGKIMRKLRIDELPQVFNVLKGDMSFVGPRPERPYFVQELTKKISYYSSRHTVRPGITGWAQIRYSYGASVEDALQKLQYDLYYVKNHSLFLDLIILLQTMQVILFGKGAR